MSRWHNGRQVPDVEWFETLPKRIRALGPRAYGRHFFRVWLTRMAFFLLAPFVCTSLACDLVREPALYSLRFLVGFTVAATAITLINELLPTTVSVNEGILAIHMPGHHHAPAEIHAVDSYPLTPRVTRLTFLTSASPHPVVLGTSPATAAAVVAALTKPPETPPMTKPPAAVTAPAQTQCHARPATGSRTPSLHTAAYTARSR